MTNTNMNQRPIRSKSHESTNCIGTWLLRQRTQLPGSKELRHTLFSSTILSHQYTPRYHGGSMCGALWVSSNSSSYQIMWYRFPENVYINPLLPNIKVNHYLTKWPQKYMFIILPAGIKDKGYFMELTRQPTFYLF